MTLQVHSIVSRMNLRLKASLLANCLGLLIWAQVFTINASFADAEIEQGRKLSGQCKICHGSTGIAQIPIAPNIAGEPVNYIINQLNAYKNGHRKHEMMSVVAQTLNDEKIDSLAKWYASQTIKAELADINSDSSVVSDCIECHGADGISKKQDTPHLAGESVIYLDTQLKAFRSGKRKHEIMTKIATELTDEKIRTISQWYANIDFNVVDP